MSNENHGELLMDPALYQSLFDTMAEGCLYCTIVLPPPGDEGAEFFIVAANSQFERLIGRKLGIAKKITDLFPAVRKNDRGFMELLERVCTTGEREQHELRIESMGKWCRVTAYSLQQGSGIFLFTDISRSRELEEELRTKSAFLYAHMQASHDGLLVVDALGRKTFQNRRAIDLWKIPQDVVDDPSGLKQVEHVMYMTKDPAQFVREINYLKTHPMEKSIDELELRDGTILERYSTPVIGEDGTNYGRIWVFHDITEMRKTEATLQNAQKLESLGLLAGGIAHDFNNLMCGIFGYIDLAKSGTTEESAQRNLTKAMHGINRARSLTQQLLTFAKGGSPVRMVGTLIPFVEETALFALSGSNVSIHFNFTDDLHACNFDRNQISQVIDNVIINAQQAMPSGGVIALSAENVFVEKRKDKKLPPGQYVRITIKDAGVGIAPELLQRVFDPFFTTKAQGRGLGLSTCYSILKRHDGCIDVVSEVGKGSTFSLYLPAVAASSPALAPSPMGVLLGEGVFVVMDDEKVLQETIARTVESLGYTVVCVGCGSDAVAYFRKARLENRRVAGMIFDLTVPGGMGGVEAVGEIRKLDSDIPVFVASGYADDPVMVTPHAYGFSGSICKPFLSDELKEMLTRTLQQL